MTGASGSETVASLVIGKKGALPYAPLVLGKNGSLYGTTAYGGSSECAGGRGCGIVFRLSPPAVADGAWTESVIHVFKGGSNIPAGAGRLLLGRNGSLYGTTYGGGTVFELRPPASSGDRWTDTVLHSFSGGGIFSATCPFGSCGTVFELAPPATAGGVWTETVLYSFTGQSDGSVLQAGLVLGKHDILYGTTEYGGFSNPACVYGSCGTVFALSGIGQ